MPSPASTGSAYDYMYTHYAYAFAPKQGSCAFFTPLVIYAYTQWCGGEITLTDLVHLIPFDGAQPSAATSSGYGFRPFTQQSIGPAGVVCLPSALCRNQLDLKDPRPQLARHKETLVGWIVCDAI